MQIGKYKDNLTLKERQAISTLKNDKNIIIKKADKNGSCVFLDKNDYILEVKRQLNTNHYQRIDHFDAKELKFQLNTYIKNMYSKGSIDEISMKYLLEGNKDKYGPGYIHILPKIHRLDQSILKNIEERGINVEKHIPPGRPIISQIGSVTEYIGHFVDYFLVPIVQKQNTYIKDTTDFINKLEQVRPHADCWLVSFDITNMFTNMPINEILPAVREAYDNFDKSDFKVKYPPTDDFIYLLQAVLENNVFEFNGELFMQKIGVAIGAVPSPECCDILMYQIMKNIFSKFEHRQKIAFYGRYRDDAAIIFEGTENEIKMFFSIANNHHPLLKFTYEYSTTSINFLDVTIYKGQRFYANGILDLKIFFKPTNSFNYLHRQSCHSKHVFSGFIKGEAIRHIRNTNEQNEVEKTLSNFKLRLKGRGYTDQEIDQNIRAASSRKRSDLLKGTSNKKSKDIPLVFSTKYNPCIKGIKKCIMKHWHTLKEDEICKNVFSKEPIIAYSKHKNLGDILTSTKLK